MTATPSETMLVGDFVTSTNIRPFMKPRRLAVSFSGLRPSVNLYVFFNGVNVSQYCRPITVPVGGNITTEASWIVNGEIGTQISTGANGVASLLFYVPAQTFLVGSGSLVVKDTLDDSYTTRAEFTYNSFNFPQSPGEEYNTRLVQVEATTQDRDLSGKTQVAGGYTKPLSWSFNVTSNMARGQEGIYASGVDLYFATKDSVFGVVVEIREMDSGKPKATNLPLSRKRLDPSEITIDGVTEVIFPGLVFLASGKDYAISLTPDGAAANYSVYTGKVGNIDKTTNSAISKDWTGQLFLPTNGSDWQSILDEYPKFQLLYAQFNASQGYATIVNRDYEFLKLSNVSSNFLPGEHVAKVTSNNLLGTVSTSNASYQLIGTGTNFMSDFNANDYIVILNSNTDIDVIRVDTIANNTSMQLKKRPAFSNALAVIQKNPVGMLDVKSQFSDEITLVHSTSANTTFLFNPGDYVVGADSTAHGVISLVQNRDVNLFQPLWSTTVVADTDLRLAGKIMGSDYSIPSESQYAFATNLVDDRSAVVASKSNEILYYAGNKSISMNVQFFSSANTLSPVLDMGIPTMVVYGNRISTNNVNEYTKSGGALSRYISKTVNLEDGLDSEDIVVTVSAFRPPNTDVDIYVKFLNGSDPDLFDNKNWTRLVNSTNNMFSSSSNNNDYVDLTYIIPTTPNSTLQIGSVSLSNTSANATGTGTSFTTAVANGDILLFTAGASTQVKKVIQVVNNTSLVLESNSNFSTAVSQYSKLSPQNSAFKDNILDAVKYYGTDGVAYVTFKTFAVKIDLLAQYAYLTPKLDNMRVIAST